MGNTLHVTLRPWLKARLNQASESVFEWSSQTHAQIQILREQGGVHAIVPLENTLLNVLDAFQAATIALDRLVPEEVIEWYRRIKTR